MDENRIIYENVNADELINFLKPVSGLGSVSGILVKLAQDEATVRVVDPAHVAMVRADWDVQTGQDMDIGIDYDQAMKALALFAGQTVKVTITDGDITIRGAKGRRTIPRLDTGTVCVMEKWPTFDLPTQIYADVAELRAAMKGVVGLSDHLRIYTSEGAAMIETGDGRAAAEFQIADNVRSIDDADAASSYPWDYFANVIKALPDGEACISLGTDYPIMISAESEALSQCYLIAPRIENE